LKILFTNIRLSSRSGTEIVVRDLASRLSERNHEVVVYTPTIGPIAAGVTSLGISVVDNLLNVPFKPDIIHGHHTPCTAEAIIAFPDVPAIWVCHDAKSWFDQPPRSAIKRLRSSHEMPKLRSDCMSKLPEMRAWKPRSPKKRIRYVHLYLRSIGRSAQDRYASRRQSGAYSAGDRAKIGASTRAHYQGPNEESLYVETGN